MELRVAEVEFDAVQNEWVVKNVSIVDTNSFGMGDNFEETQELYRKWWGAITKGTANLDNLVLVHSDEQVEPGAIWDKKKKGKTQFRKKRGYDPALENDIAFEWDEEYGDYFNKEIYQFSKARREGKNLKPEPLPKGTEEGPARSSKGNNTEKMIKW